MVGCVPLKVRWWPTGERSVAGFRRLRQGADAGFKPDESDGEVSVTFAAPSAAPSGWRGSEAPSAAAAAAIRSDPSAALATSARWAAGEPAIDSRIAWQVDGEPAADLGPALDAHGPAVHVDDRADDGEAEAAPAAARLVRTRSAVEALEDVRELARIDPDAGVGDVDAGTVVGRRHRDADRSATRRELHRVADEVRDDLADARRIVADADGCRGQVDGQPNPASGRGGVVLVGRRFDRGTQVVRAQVQQDEARVELRELEQVLGEPVEPFDLARARLEELGARVGVVAGALHEQLVERAQGGQRACGARATRRPGSRGCDRGRCRLISTLSSRRSAIVLNWTASSPSSEEPARNWAAGTRRERSPSARARDASVSWRSGVVNRRVSAAETTTARPRAKSPIAARSPVTFAMALARNVDGLASVTSSE